MLADQPALGGQYTVFGQVSDGMDVLLKISETPVDAGDDPASAATSFFICTGPSTALDGIYTAFGRVIDGLSVVEAIEKVPRTGETPNERVELRTIRIEQK